MGAAVSSSLSSKKYEVFLSFRGEDTRKNFTSHLHTALCLRGIETFIDYELPKGDEISEALIEAIENSRISVVIFSENYATSKWCLNELIEILRCKEHNGQLVVPIFYQVDPSHVRNQTGTYEEAFAKHLKKNPEKVDKWRQALSETASLVGWDSHNCRDEAELIQNIANDIIRKLNHGSSSVLANIVGIEENSDHIELLLEGFSTIGIWGMGGIGKTTMAKVIFAKFLSQYDSYYFLENLREESEKHGLKCVRDKIFYELLKDTSLKGLSCRKVLIVLDDVSHTSQLDYLESEVPPLGPGSKVIITSRDKHVLDGRVEKIYKAKALGYDNSLKLFNLKAFRKDGYKSEYKKLVERAVAYAQGIPLALTILGSFLYSKTIKEWESALTKIERTTHQDIQAVLKLSYDGLDDEEKEIFLDIACFFKGESRGYVIAMLESCGFHASIGLRTLMDKALVSVDYAVWMHDLIQSMAFEIVRQECIKNPGGRSRLWNPDEIYDVLKNNQGSDAIQGISLDLSQIRDLQLSDDAFRKMTNLRFLKFYSPEDKRSCTVNLPSELKSFANSLKYLQWDNFPSKSLPLSFCAEKLVELRMPNSHLQKLWDGVQNLVNLRKINLAGSKQLMELPDFFMAHNLERIDLYGCESLCHFDPSILSLPRLTCVELKDCRSLKSLKSESQSKSLSRLVVCGCYNLKEFSFSSNKITYLRLEETCVEVLDFSIGRMEKLQKLSLNGLALKNLPINQICCMRSLQELRLYDCGGIIDKSKLHTLFDSLLSLKSISLSGTYCKLTELPNNIRHLLRLQFLRLSNCKSLQSLPELPPSIEELNFHNCSSLKTLQLITSHIESSTMLGGTTTLCSSVSYLGNIQKLILRGCEKLLELPEEIGSLSSLSSLDLEGTNVESLPVSIKNLSNLEYIYLSNCARLCSLPELSPSINSVHANDCKSLEILPISITYAPQLRFLFLKNCLKLENHSLSHVMERAYFSLKRLVYTKQRGGLCYPGRKASGQFRFNQVTTKASSKCATIELSSITNNLIGFIFYSVISHHPKGDLQCQLYYDGKHRKCSKFNMMMTDFDSHHVFLWCDPHTFRNFHKTVGDQSNNYKPKVSFEFSIVPYRGKFIVDDDVIEACGVCPVYASEYHSFIQQMELMESNMRTQKETFHSFHGMLKYATLSLEQGKRGNNFEEGINNIPEWFTYTSSIIKHGHLKVNVQIASDFENIMGFIFFFVIVPHFSSKERDQSHSSCECRLYDCSDDDRRQKYYGFHLEGPIEWHYSMVKLDSNNNVFLWYDPHYCEHVLQKLRRRRRRGKGNNKEELEFAFKFGDGLIEQCGLRPIYVLEYTKFLQEQRLRGSTMQGKRPQNIDDDQQYQLPVTKKLKESSMIESISLNSSQSKTSHDVDELMLMFSQLNLESTRSHSSHHK